MRKLFQTHWHGIPFSRFSNMSETNLAAPEFYNSFYNELFAQYQGYEQLDTAWKGRKEEIAEWLAKKSIVNDDVIKKKKILSIGCGLGVIEYYLFSNYQDNAELFVQDNSSNAHKWLLNFLQKERIFLSQESLSGEFDMVYLSAVDYALNDNDLIKLLSYFKKFLKTDGILIMISASYLKAFSCRSLLLYPLKDSIAWILKFLRLYKYNKKQFWGWMRTRSEYRRIMSEVSFSTIEDGFIPPSSQNTYWISGRLK